MKDYLTFKLNQHNRLQAQPLTGAELQEWVKSQITNRTELFVNFCREAIAAGC